MGLPVSVGGIELSPDMVDRMREKPDGHPVTVTMGDMSRVTTGRSYGLVHLVYNTIGDNGASAEGTTQGTFNEMISLNGMGTIETPEIMAERLDQWGGPESAPHYAVGWAHAMCAPYQWTKQVASHWGGTRNGTIVHWPGGIQAKGELRHQFHHVIDVAPTLLEAAGLPEPAQVPTSYGSCNGCS